LPNLFAIVFKLFLNCFFACEFVTFCHSGWTVLQGYCWRLRAFEPVQSEAHCMRPVVG
jgi:hypothetical protein